MTHCHADHDAGTFQKILCHGKITLITTRTIKDSFLRKYAAITGFDNEFLNGLFSFVPAVIGQPVRFHGSEIKFFLLVAHDPVRWLRSLLWRLWQVDDLLSRHIVQPQPRQGSRNANGDRQIASSPASQLSLQKQARPRFSRDGIPPIHTYKDNLVKEIPKVGSKKHKSTIVVVHSRWTMPPKRS